MTVLTRSLITGLVLGMLGGVAAPASAQAVDTLAQQPAPAVWMQHFEAQVVQLLRAPDANRREGAMQLIIHYGQQRDASGEPVFGFKKATPELLDIYRYDPERGHRLLALAALGAIDDAPALQALASTVPGESSEVVRKQAIRVISAHLRRQ